jgi:hypothetical protein
MDFYEVETMNKRVLPLIISLMLLLTAFAGMPGYAMALTDQEVARSIEIVEPKYGTNNEVFIRDNLYLSIRLLRDINVSMNIVRWDGFDIVRNLERLRPIKLSENFASEYRTTAYRGRVIDEFVRAYEKRIVAEFDLSRIQEEIKLKTGSISAAELKTLEERRQAASRELSAVMIEYDAAAYQFRRIAQVTVYDSQDIKVGTIPTFRVTLEKPGIGTYLINFKRNDINKTVKIERIHVRALDSAQDLPNNAYDMIKSSLTSK